jgi:hypothetical protein
MLVKEKECNRHYLALDIVSLFVNCQIGEGVFMGCGGNNIIILKKIQEFLPR